MNPSSPHFGRETDREIERERSREPNQTNYLHTSRGRGNPMISIISTLLGGEGESNQTDILCTTVGGGGGTQRAHHLHTGGERGNPMNPSSPQCRVDRERAQSNRPPPFQWGERESNEPTISTLLGERDTQSNRPPPYQWGERESDEPIISTLWEREREIDGT